MGNTLFYSASYYDNVDKIQTRKKMYNKVLRQNQNGITALSIIAALLGFLLIVGSIVPNYAYNSPAGVLALPHSIFGLGPMVVVIITLLSVYFDINVKVQRTVVLTLVAIVFFIFALLASFTHIAFIIIELVNCATNLCLNTDSLFGKTSIWITLGVEIALVIIYIWTMIRLSVYRRNLQNAIELDWSPQMYDIEGQQISLGNKIKNNKKRAPLSSTNYFKNVLKKV